MIIITVQTKVAMSNLSSLPADVRWGLVVVTHSFLPHGRLLNRADIYVHQSQAVYGFL